ncbi:MAG: saccharopine dehydrogenase, partial [Acidobacteria bacterium]|nr:saccharopine dehydrogenase [Acidobacteriota bacterium]
PFILWNRTLSRARIALDDSSGQARELDWAELTKAVQPGDVAVSMLPADLHSRVADLCLQRGSHFISSSYISPSMQALDAESKANGLRFVNEVGLDPGIDHLMAHALMADYQGSGAMNPAHEHRFHSFCGGFPSQPNDFRYKFSWSPLGVLRALKTPARWIENGAERTTDKPWKALSSYVVNLPDGKETFQAYPNRDSIPFAKQYGFNPEFNLQTFVRGTLRLNGWAEAWQDIFAVVEDSATDENELKLLSDSLWKEYAYDPDEPDRVILHVEMTVTSDGQPVWSGAYALDEHGNATGSAMARLVSKTVSIAVEAVLDGELPPGVSAAPSNPQIVDVWMTKLIASGERIIRT